MIEATQNNPYQLNVDACLKDGKIFSCSLMKSILDISLESGGTQPKQTTPVIRKRRNTQICSKFYYEEKQNLITFINRFE